MVKHGGDARLLQHDFAQPDAVGFASFTPRKIAAMLVVPAEHCTTEGSQAIAAQWTWRRGQPPLYGNAGGAHYCWVTLCAISTHPDFCCCHTVIMC